MKYYNIYVKASQQYTLSNYQIHQGSAMIWVIKQRPALGISINKYL